MQSVIEILSWTLLVILLLGGLAGVLLPFLPGALIIFLGALLHKILTPEWLSWTTSSFWVSWSWWNGCWISSAPWSAPNGSGPPAGVYSEPWSGESWGFFLVFPA